MSVQAMIENLDDAAIKARIDQISRHIDAILRNVADLEQGPALRREPAEDTDFAAPVIRDYRSIP